MYRKRTCQGRIGNQRVQTGTGPHMIRARLFGPGLFGSRPAFFPISITSSMSKIFTFDPSTCGHARCGVTFREHNPRARR